MTTHSLAYRAVVKSRGYTLGPFNARDITGRLSWEKKREVIEVFKEYCLSKYVDFSEFSKERNIPNKIATLVEKYLGLMESGTIPCTHEFYLKMFHLGLASGDIEFNPFDFIMLDEAGDLNEVTLEVFKHLPSNKKIAVGDKHQNVFSFNHTINCFEVLKDEGVTFSMTTSFRVGEKIAKRIEGFCKRCIDPDMEFKGVPTDNKIKTVGFITRTNSALIAKMIELNDEGTPYSLVRKAKDIFELPLTIIGMSKGGFIKNPAYRYMQEVYDKWYTDLDLMDKFKSPLSYVASECSKDIQISSAVRLVLKYSNKVLFATYAEAKHHENTNYDLTLATAHSVKGLEMDQVVIDGSMNHHLTGIMSCVASGELSVEDQLYKDAVNLYYVACSRAKKSLLNATLLDVETPLKTSERVTNLNVSSINRVSEAPTETLRDVQTRIVNQLAPELMGDQDPAMLFWKRDLYEDTDGIVDEGYDRG